GTDSFAEGVSGDVVVGSFIVSGQFHAFAYDLGAGGPMTDLGTLGGTFGVANEASGGIVVGYSDTAASSQRHAFAYDLGTGGPMTDLGTLGGTSSQALGVSGDLVVGYAFTAPGQARAFVYDLGTGGPMTDLGTLGGTTSSAHGVSGDLVVGYSTTVSGQNHATVWRLGVTPAADLAVTKAVDRPLGEPGQIVAYTLRVTNAGPTAAGSVTVTDTLPAGLSFHSAPGCGHAGQTVTCDLGTVPAAGEVSVTIRAVVDPVVPGASHSHQLEVTKVESHLSIPPGQTMTATATCPTGYNAVDGSVRLDQVDQDTGTLANVIVLASKATADGHGWTGTVRNTSTGQAQVKVNTVCLSPTTTSGESHTHDVNLGGFVTAENVTGTHTLTCPTGVPVAPGFAFDSGAVPVSTARVGSGWGFDVGTGVADLSIRCMSTRLGSTGGHSHDLVTTHLTGTASVPAGGTVEPALTCPVGFKGITAWAALDAGLVPLGTDPQPITRLFRFYNPTSSDLNADYGLGCLGLRTGNGTLTNTATVTAATPDPDLTNNTDTATMAVTLTGVHITSPRVRIVSTGNRTSVKTHLASTRTRLVTIKLVALGPLAGTSLGRGDVLARTTTRLTTGAHPVRLSATRAGTPVLRRHQVHTAKLVVITPAGVRTTREVTIK
ncbi:conserved repeat domain-containing protein, partial [Nocardioides psychrotolerans]